MIRFSLARSVGSALLLCTTMLLSACLGGGGSSGGNANLRVLNLTNDLASVDVTFTGGSKFSAVAQQAVTSSVSVPAQSFSVSVASAGSPTSLFSGTYTLAKDLHYTAVVWGSADSLHLATLPEDQNDNLVTGTTEVRVFNASANAGAFDVYLTPVAQSVPDLTGVAATRASVSSGAISGYSLLSTGDYRLRITGAGNPQDVRLDVPSVTLGNQQYATVIVTAGSGNSLVNATVLVQQGSLTAFNNGNARVRLVASVQINGDSTRSAVSVKIDGTAMPSGSLRSPDVGPYTTLTSGNHQFDVLLNGTVVSTTTQSIAAGVDYTLMAWGPQSAPQVTLITDDNSVPAIGKVQLRLINGDDTAGAVSLLVDSGNLAIFGVAPGDASPYSLYSATTGSTTSLRSTLEVFAQDSANFGALYSNPAQNLISQGVYTVFLLRGGLSSTTGQPAPTGLLRKDR